MLEVALLPTTISDGPGARGQFLTSYLINRAIAIDAGGLGLLGDLNAQFGVTDVFLTHSHMDHIASLPLLLDTAFGPRGPSVRLHASEATLDCLRRDIFNDRVWPSFLDMTRDGKPLIEVDVLEAGRPVEVHGLRLTPIEVDHVVPTLGFLIESPTATVAIPSDTGPTAAFWQAAQDVRELDAVFLECSFPNARQDLADISKHLTPATFAAEIAKLARLETRVIAVHIKPWFFDQVAADLVALGLPGVEIGRPGRVYSFG